MQNAKAELRILHFAFCGIILSTLAVCEAGACFEPTRFRWELRSYELSYAAGRRRSQAGTPLHPQVRNWPAHGSPGHHSVLRILDFRLQLLQSKI